MDIVGRAGSMCLFISQHSVKINSEQEKVEMGKAEKMRGKIMRLLEKCSELAWIKINTSIYNHSHSDCLQMCHFI